MSLKSYWYYLPDNQLKEKFFCLAAAALPVWWGLNAPSLSHFSSLGKLPLTSPQTKMNTKQATASLPCALSSNYTCVLLATLYKSTVEKRKNIDRILHVHFAGLGKSPNHLATTRYYALKEIHPMQYMYTNCVQETHSGKDSVHQIKLINLSQ